LYFVLRKLDLLPSSDRRFSLKPLLFDPLGRADLAAVVLEGYKPIKLSVTDNGTQDEKVTHTF